MEVGLSKVQKTVHISCYGAYQMLNNPWGTKTQKLACCLVPATIFINFSNCHLQLPYFSFSLSPTLLLVCHAAAASLPLPCCVAVISFSGLLFYSIGTPHPLLLPVLLPCVTLTIKPKEFRRTIIF